MSAGWTESVQHKGSTTDVPHVGLTLVVVGSQPCDREVHRSDHYMRLSGVLPDVSTR